MYTTIRHELCHARKAWCGSLVDHAFSEDYCPSPLSYKAAWPISTPVFLYLYLDYGPCYQREGIGLLEYQAKPSLPDIAHDGWLNTFTI